LGGIGGGGWVKSGATDGRKIERKREEKVPRRFQWVDGAALSGLRFSIYYFPRALP
jgi:hypothetical protein